MSKPSLASNEPVDLVIVGAGPVGTSLAVLAVQRGFSTGRLLKSENLAALNNHVYGLFQIGVAITT